MRLYKRAAVGLLAAAMALSMMTACGGAGGGMGGGSGAGTGGIGGSGTGDGTDSGIGGGTGTGGGSGTGTGGSGTDSETGGIDFDYDSTTGGTADKVLEAATPISNTSSRMVQYFGKSYTAEFSANFGALKDQTGNFEADMMITTDGSKTYSGGVGTLGAGGLTVTQGTATLTDKPSNKEWIIDLNKGTYTVQKWISDDASNIGMDADLMKRARIYRGTYKVDNVEYAAEAFSVVQTSDGIPMTLTIIYLFNSNGMPKAMVARGYALGGLINDELLCMVFKNYTQTAKEELLDFEKILSNYKAA